MTNLIKLPTDHPMRTRLWDANWDCIYDSGAPGSITPKEAIQYGIGKQINWTVDMLGNRWSGRVEWSNGEPMMVDSCEDLKVIMAYSNPLLEADTVG
jgi:hypothetical protein